MDWVRYIETHGLSYRGGTTEFDIARSIQWLLFDMICRLCFDVPFGFVSNHADQFDFQKTLEERLPVVEKLAIFARIDTILQIIAAIPLLRRILPSAQDKSGIGKIMGVCLLKFPEGGL